MHYDQLFPRCCPVQTPDRFTNFQRLPAEIRMMIWEYALPDARVYEVLDAPNSKQKTPPQQGLMFANVHPEPPPALAAVCQESRYYVLRHYKPLTLGATTKFVDMSRDMLLLEPYLLVKRLHRTLHFMSQIPLVRDHATRLALGTSYGVYPGIFHPVLGRKVSKNNMAKLLSSLAKFPKLKTLIFIVHQEFQFEFDFRFPGTMTPIPNSYSPPMMASLPGHAPNFTPGFGYPSPPASTAGSSAAATLSPLSTPSVAATNTTTANSPATLPSSVASATSISPVSPPPLPLPSFPHYYQHQHPHQNLSQPQPHPEPQPQPQRQQQHQQVHQAYRFKFDIEANINAAPHLRPRHANELLYYPLDIDEDREDALWDQQVTAMMMADGSNGSSSNGDESGDEGEWCDPWPTNDDWRRFRRRFLRAMVCASASGGEGPRRGKGLRVGGGMGRVPWEGMWVLWEWEWEWEWGSALGRDREGAKGEGEGWWWWWWRRRR
ncbi:hypothetical protein MMYC01_208915 [Madurella mycetomatis]|uniref:2EXR domain-containing protein n=1 Tax=Madurella mycetomatis TaxID=100816 RepID=A0A175VSD9_9PEZI|nr:hypothetical protein MMYC01_208915 [Madurella mycetomatis]